MRAATAYGDPLRIWHAMVFECLLATEDGHLNRGAELAESAYHYGLLHGFGAATTIRVGQVFTHEFALRRHGALLDAFDLVEANVKQSTIAQAALALSLWAGGKTDEATDLAGRLIDDAVSRPRSLSLPVVCLVAEIMGTAGTPHQIDTCRQFLLPFRHTSPVVGFGIAGMGPTWRYLAHLAADDHERVAWLHFAVGVSDRLGSVTWRILNRISLALACGDETYLAQARNLAQGTDLPVDEITDRWRIAAADVAR